VKFLGERNGYTAEEGYKLLALREKYGYDNWYDWCSENWDTKWNARRGRLESISDKKAILHFDTAWGPPINVIQVLSEKFPSYCFTLKYYEGGMRLKGVFAAQGGEVLKDETSDYRGRRGG